MIIEIKVPSPGESIAEVEMASWLVPDGEYVEKDQEVAEVESDKATLPLIAEELIRPGAHITAMGSDTSAKQELDPKILQKADLVVADSIAQCLERGEISKALMAGLITEGTVVELGCGCAFNFKCTEGTRCYCCND